MNNLKNHNCYTLSRNSNRCDVCGARLPRLIDADALKKAINDNGCRHSHYFDIFDVIDNAPTIEERPKGKWLVYKDNYGNDKPVCSCCNKEQIGYANYCSNCGARMESDA